MSTWLINEDEAMKAYLQGLAVHDTTSAPAGRPVKVWFRNPEQEEVERTYPYVTIDLFDIVEAHNRTMVNTVKLTQLAYTPPGNVPTVQADHTRVADRPVPVDLHYQISAVTRNAWHDRELQRLIWAKFPGKWGALPVPADGTARTMQLVGRSSSSDVDENGKRTFRTNYTVTVASELWASVIKQVHDMTSIEFSVTIPGLSDWVIGDLACHSEP